MYFAHGGVWNALANAPTGTADQLLANDGGSGFTNITLGSGLSLAAGVLTASAGGGGGGGGAAGPILESAKTISTNYSITAGNNAGSFGPVTIASGVQVNIASGQVWQVF
jgi:hypothetical protein